MIAGLAGRLVSVALSLALTTLIVGALLSGGGPFERIRESINQGNQGADRAQLGRAQERKRERRGRRSNKAARGDRGAEGAGRPDLSRALESRGRVVAGLWRAVRLPAALLGLTAAALLALRIRARHRRRQVRFWLLPYRADEATPDQVRRLIESWHQMTLRRWWQRLLTGQPALALEFHAIPDEAGTRLRLLIACPGEPGLAESLDARLSACYRDSRMIAAGPVSIATRELLRLKKRRSFIRRLDTPERYEQSSVDSLAATMGALGEPCTVQITLVPTPASFDRFARWLFRREERGYEQDRVKAEGADPGSRSEVTQQELEGGLEIQNRPLFFCDIRVCATSYAVCRRAAGAIRGESGAENRLVERRIWLRQRLYAGRIGRALANPLPSWSRGVVSSSELAGLWQLPSPFLKGVRIERSSVPRVPAPPQVARPQPGRELCLDERGPIGIADADKRMNLMLLGTQGTGKTSVMCRGIADDAADPDCALIVLDGKSDLALKALSVIPEELGDARQVHYLDFAHPEIGIDPFTAEADRDAVADGIVEAFKDVHEDGSIQASSDRYLRQAAIACMGWIEKTEQGSATLWDMWTLLLPSADEFRKQVVRAISTDVELAAPAMFFGEQLPDQLHAAKGQFAPRLDSPVNKIQKLTGQPKLDTILRHPMSLSIDEVIRNRDVLVVSGSVGAFGEGSAKVLLQFILHMVHRALIRQQLLPEAERGRVALKIDEAHLLFSSTFARMLAMDRSAGLECVAAWQSLGQIEDKALRSVILNLLRHRLVFSLADDDAREMTNMLQTAYADVVRDDQAARARMRITPDALMNLPNFHAAASWIVKGERVPSFIARTLPMTQDDARIERHLEAQRQRGAHYPGPLSPPQRLADYLKVQDLVPREPEHEQSEEGRVPDSAVQANGGHTGSSRSTAAPKSQTAGGHAAEAPPVRRPPSPTASDAAAQARPALDPTPEPRPKGDPADKVGVAALGSDTGVAVPDSFTELELENPTGLRWQKRPPGPHKPPVLRREDLEILAALHELRFLYASQIGRRFMSGKALRSVQHRLGLMFKAGWVRRGEITTGRQGHNQRVYAIDERGHELIQDNRGRTDLASNVDPEAKFRAPEVVDPRIVIHDLHANAWLFALERLLVPRALMGWRGPRNSILRVPREKVRGQWLELAPDRVPLGTGQHLADLALDEFAPVRPDLTVELDLSIQGKQRRVDLLIELDRSGRASSNYEKFRRYDALINGWALSLSRYKALGEPPVAVFVVEDDEKARQLLEAADTLVTGRIGKYGVAESQWPHYGRRRMFVVAERDVHQGTLRAQRLPEHPPALRKALHGRGADRLEPEQLPSLLPEAYLCK